MNAITNDIPNRLDSNQILEQLATGEPMSAIAAKCNFPALLIVARLSKEAPEAYRLARELGVEARLAVSRSIMEKATDAFQLKRALENFKADMWLAECEFPECWRQNGSTRVLDKKGLPAKTVAPVQILLSRQRKNQTRPKPPVQARNLARRCR
jgi:hypothetical protein